MSSRMRPIEDVQRAHDLFLPLVTGEVEIPGFDAGPAMRAALDVLCWTLGHDHNTAFAENIERIERVVKAAGWKLGVEQKETEGTK